MNKTINTYEEWLLLAQLANWSVKKLAKLRGVSVRTLEIYFQKNMHQTPKTWLSEQRHLQAVELLRMDCAVKKTAATLGYKHAHHFSREFKKRWGYCPTQLILEATKLRILV